VANEQKKKIEYMRGMGESYAAIADALGISVNTVKSYCRRNGLGGRMAASVSTSVEPVAVCKQCGNPLVQLQGMKPRKFCSPSCRSAWWAAHPQEIRQKAVYSFTCAKCSAGFTAYGNKGRKYCSHACYVADRFEKGAEL